MSVLCLCCQLSSCESLTKKDGEESWKQNVLLVERLLVRLEKFFFEERTIQGFVIFLRLCRRSFLFIIHILIESRTFLWPNLYTFLVLIWFLLLFWYPFTKTLSFKPIQISVCAVAPPSVGAVHKLRLCFKREFSDSRNFSSCLHRAATSTSEIWACLFSWPATLLCFWLTQWRRSRSQNSDV